MELTAPGGLGLAASAAYAAEAGAPAPGGLRGFIEEGKRALQRAEEESRALPPRNYEGESFYPGVSSKTLTGGSNKKRLFKSGVRSGAASEGLQGRASCGKRYLDHPAIQHENDG